jgi:hypothetical protein
MEFSPPNANSNITNPQEVLLLGIFFNRQIRNPGNLLDCAQLTYQVVWKKDA